MNGLGRGFANIPMVVKNLIIINVMIFVFDYFLNGVLNEWLALYFFKNPMFRPFQIITTMFAHGGFFHIGINMFILWMFGRNLEQIWGPKRFLTFYIICGIGASLIYSGWNYYQYQQVVQQLSAEHVQEVIRDGKEILLSGRNYSDGLLAKLNIIWNGSAVGASGAIFGIVVAFAMLFPNTKFMLIFLPIPIKAKYFLPGYILIELILGLANFKADPIAHFAHLGGALVGFILMKYWKMDKHRFN